MDAVPPQSRRADVRTDDRYTSEQYWNRLYEEDRVEDLFVAPDSRTKRAVKQLLGNRVIDYLQSYSEHLFRHIVFEQHVSVPAGAKVLEIGSAPGTNLIKFHDAFDCEPYGIEYTQQGVDVNRRLFQQHNLDPNNVLHADFFDDRLLNELSESFDIVLSRGFIEHFSDVRSVVDRHVKLVKPGGYVIIEVPNLRGINYALTWLLQRDLIPLHNLDIMKKKNFTKLFDMVNVRNLYCDHYGTFNLGVIGAAPGSVRQLALLVLARVQQLLNLMFRLVLRNRGIDSGLWSPYLLYVGRKHGAGGT